jgi:hypothetical protein
MMALRADQMAADKSSHDKSTPRHQCERALRTGRPGTTSEADG